MKFVSFFQALIALMISTLLELSAADRVALVIGNREYAHGRQLDTVLDDAGEIAAQLRQAGFEVMEKWNLRQNDFGVVRGEFLGKARDATAVLIYFAGYGTGSQALGGSFLLPVDAPLGSETQIKEKGWRLQALLGDLRGSRAQVRLVVLDCCRTLQPEDGTAKDALPIGLGTLNLQQLDAATMVVFSAAPGAVAPDRVNPADRHSPFTAAFLRQLAKPGASAFGVFAAVEDEVAALTRGSCTPKTFFSGSLGRFNDFVFRRQPPDGMPLEAGPGDAYLGFAGEKAGDRKFLEIAPKVRIPFRWCPPGSFVMGSSKGEQQMVPPSVKFNPDDETEHLVTLTRGFWMAETEVTIERWQAIAGTSVIQQGKKALEDDTLYPTRGVEKTYRDSVFMKRTDDPQVGKALPKDPMIFVNASEAQDWCSAVNRQLNRSRWAVSLPTEAQWEYACRAGTIGVGYDGDFEIAGDYNAPGLGRIAWYAGNSCLDFGPGGWTQTKNLNREVEGNFAGPRLVATRKPNPWNLHDMLGNVSEWCIDCYGKYPLGEETDPAARVGDARGVLRGGNWESDVYRCRIAARQGVPRTYRGYRYGFRPVVTFVR